MTEGEATFTQMYEASERMINHMTIEAFNYSGCMDEDLESSGKIK